MTSEDRAVPRTEAGKRLPANAAKAWRDYPAIVDRNAALLRIAAIIEAEAREAAAAPVLDVARLRKALAGRVPPFVVDEAAAEYQRLSPPPVAAVAEDPEAYWDRDDPVVAGVVRAGDRDRREAAAPGAAALDRLIEAGEDLADTGNHRPDCPQSEWSGKKPECDCGWHDALSEWESALGARAAEPKPPDSKP